jgi:hypothetical protein
MIRLVRASGLGVSSPRHDPAQPGRLRGQRGGQQVVSGAVVLGAEDEAVDVAAAEPRRSSNGAVLW